MKKYYITFIGLFLITLWCGVYASQPTLDIMVDKTNIDINQTFTLKLKIVQNQNEQMWEIQTKWLEQFDVLSTANSTSLQIINENISYTNLQQYVLKPIKTWELVIWPFSVQIWNKTYNSQEIKVNVTWTSVSNLSINQTGNNSSPTIIQWSLANNIINSNNDTKLNLNKGLWNYFFVIMFFWSFFVLIWLFVIWNIWFKKEDKTNIKIIDEINDYQINNKIELIIPNIDDIDFNNKIDRLIRDYVTITYWFDIQNLTYEEMLVKLKERGFYNVWILPTILQQIKYIKYWNTVYYKEQLIELLKQLIKK